MKNNLLMTISTGWAYRNYISTGVLDTVSERWNTTVVTTPHLAPLFDDGVSGNKYEVVVKPDLKEPLVWALVRQMKKKIHQHARASNTERLWRKYVARPLYQRIGGRVFDLILGVFDPVKLLRALERWEIAVNQHKPTQDLVEELRPDLIFFSHLSNFFDDSILNAGVKKGIKTNFMVLSWDHLSSKVILRTSFDKVYVWNQVTKDEIIDLNYGYRDSQIVVSGILQYDKYLEEPDLDYAGWCARYGLDPQKKTILFSTMPQVRHDQQHTIIQRLIEHLKESSDHRGKVQLLIKCHPFDNTDLYDSLVSDNDDVSIERPSLPPGAASQNWVPRSREIEISRDCLYFCSLNINIFSTVTIEAAMLDKPIIHIGFDPIPVKNRIPCREYYNFEHFRPITDSGVSDLVTSFDELFVACDRALSDPTRKHQERRSLADQYAPEFGEPASARFAKLLLAELDGADLAQQ